MKPPANPFPQVIHYLEGQPPFFSAILSLLLVLLLATVDHLIPSELNLSIVYAVPILMGSWFAGVNFGSFIAMTSAILWLSSEISQFHGGNPWLPYWNMSVSLGFFMMINHLLAALKAGYEREKRLARTDGLTGVTNRRYFYELLQAECLRSRRYRYPLTVAYIDVDNFKTVNDRFGHATGDLLLSLISQCMLKQVRSIDVVARLGGDEFALMLPQTGPQEARIVLPRVQQQLMQIVQEHQWPISFSMGVATFIRLPKTVKEVVDHSDTLMYHVKTHGKNRINYDVVGLPATPVPNSANLMARAS